MITTEAPHGGAATRGVAWPSWPCHHGQDARATSRIGTSGAGPRPNAIRPYIARQISADKHDFMDLQRSGPARLSPIQIFTGRRRDPSSASYLSTFSPGRRSVVKLPSPRGEGGGHAPPGEGSLLSTSHFQHVHKNVCQKNKNRRSCNAEMPTQKAFSLRLRSSAARIVILRHPEHGPGHSSRSLPISPGAFSPAYDPAERKDRGNSPRAIPRNSRWSDRPRDR